MCGIAGVISFGPQHRVTREMLAAMSNKIAHRGPDGEGLWLNHTADGSPDRPQVGFVHRRLAILDPDPRSNQPFTDGRGHWLTYNGEIYNFRELRQQLQSLLPDWTWKTTGDTEVLLAAYVAWGERCVDHLNGMFAFAVWDENERSLFLARDRMGQKPLFVAEADTDDKTTTAFAFASELPALMSVGWVDRTLAEPSLREYLRWGCIGNGTIYCGAEKLGPSWWMKVTRDRMTAGTYFDLAHGDYPAPPTVPIRDGVRQAVARQMVSDVPIGCFLSGGVDSSVIAACMKAQGGEVLTFSIGFNDRRYDESNYARNVAEHLGTRHHAFQVTPDAAADLPKLAAAFGEPFADSSALPTHYLARQTRQHLKVALSGDGGDELFGGYDRYRAVRLASRLDGLVPSVVTAAARRLGGGHPKSQLARVARFLSSLDQDEAHRYASYLRLFDEPAIDLLLGCNSAVPDEVADEYAQLRCRGFDAVQAALACDRTLYLPHDLLTKVDRASMLHNLEVRSPFMDHELVHFAAGLTTDQLLKGGGKRMLREAFAADLPAWVFKRRKMGFAVPIGDWFRTSLRGILHDHLFAKGSFAADRFQMNMVRKLVNEHEQSRVDHSQRLYALLMLELWWKGQK